MMVSSCCFNKMEEVWSEEKKVGEIQNNGMRFDCGGSVVTVLDKSFSYTSNKLMDYHEQGEDLCRGT